MATTTRTPAVDAPKGADRTADLVLSAAVIAMGLLAGLIYDWAITVMPALTAADDRTLVDAMQQTVDNPAFPRTFLAAGGLAALALVLTRRCGSPDAARWIVAGLALYAVAVLITGVIHLPLNTDIKQAGDPAHIQNLTAVRDDFATPWVAWNIVRMLATTTAFGALAWALVLRGRTAAQRRLRRRAHIRKRSGGRDDLDVPIAEHVKGVASLWRVRGQPTAARSARQQQSCRGDEAGGPLVERANAPVTRVDDVHARRAALGLDASVRAPHGVGVVARECDPSLADPRGSAHDPHFGTGRSRGLEQLPHPIQQRRVRHEPVIAHASPSQVDLHHVRAR